MRRSGLQHEKVTSYCVSAYDNLVVARDSLHEMLCAKLREQENISTGTTSTPDLRLRLGLRNPAKSKAMKMVKRTDFADG